MSNSDQKYNALQAVLQKRMSNGFKVRSLILGRSA